VELGAGRRMAVRDEMDGSMMRYGINEGGLGRVPCQHHCMLETS